MSRDVSRGSPYPLGATVEAAGTNFSLFSEHADSVSVCLFDSAQDPAPSETIPLRWQTAGVFHGFVSGIRQGQVYGYRVAGPWAPDEGHRFDSRKVLLDPYARAIAREACWDPSIYAYRANEYPDPSAVEQVLNGVDSARSAPLGAVVGPVTGDGVADRPRTAWRDTVIYELHVRGFTKLHPDLAPDERGTYKGLGSGPVLEYLQGLGITAVELQPVQHSVTEPRLRRLGLVNYWGYQPLAYFAPEPAYAVAGGLGAVEEFREMVRNFHGAGIEVILDVVFNHTGELGLDGPMLSFRGIDNATYYRLDPSDQRKYLNYTGCGNTFNTHHPAVLRLVLDSLRYWVETMGVDGFRFDLAATLGRTSENFDRWAPLFAAIRQAPALQGIKLIAEPWDLKPEDGDQLGNFPRGWSEWNRCFRDDVRRYWMGHDSRASALATRLAGSSDVFRHRRRRPQASINFVTSHDGFTLADLVTYEGKRNDANGESGRDGEDWNHNWNCGAEGPTADLEIVELRARVCRNLLATLFLSQGVPMLVAGDEFGRTQAGNNNAYCQDNATSWLDWNLAKDHSLAGFVRELLRIRAAEPAFRRESFFEGAPDPATGRKDIAWIRPDGTDALASGWSSGGLECFGAEIAGSRGQRYLVLCNPTAEPCGFQLPACEWGVRFDTSTPDAASDALPGAAYEVGTRSLVLLVSAQ